MMDFIYTYDFKKKDLKETLDRLYKSLNSINYNDFNVCLINCSRFCIKKYLNEKINYIHIPRYKGIYNRSFMINQVVEKLVTNEYFNISDIDIIYPPTFKETIDEIIRNSNEPCRIVYFNNNMGIGDYFTYEECKNDFEINSDFCRSKRGRAGGLGIVHTESFKQVNGFEERYLGYGPEDVDFNNRIIGINKYIEIDNPRVNTYHLWHKNDTPRTTYRENMRKFFYISDKISKNYKKIIKAGEIELPNILLSQKEYNIEEIDEF